MTDNQHSERDILQALTQGSFDVAGQFVHGSNYTFLVELSWQDWRLEAVYKPARGERPLWDFPQGTLANREAAAYEVSRALKWDFVPPTVLRQEGPAGTGSLQYYVDLNPDRHYFSMTAQEKQWLQPVALFDALINNADRKGGHILLAPDDRIWLIDHGLCFHQEPKLRTVVWDFAGEPIPASLLDRLEQFLTDLEKGPLLDRLQELLSLGEVVALADRGQALIEAAEFPSPGERRHYPWPLV